MSYYIVPDADEARGQQVASVGGWADVRAWAETFSPAGCPELQHLLEHGWSQEVQALRTEIESERRAHPPTADVGHTLDALVGALPPEATIVNLTQT